MFVGVSCEPPEAGSLSDTASSLDVSTGAPLRPTTGVTPIGFLDLDCVILTQVCVANLGGKFKVDQLHILLSITFYVSIVHVIRHKLYWGTPKSLQG